VQYYASLPLTKRETLLTGDVLYSCNGIINIIAPKDLNQTHMIQYISKEQTNLIVDKESDQIIFHGQPMEVHHNFNAMDTFIYKSSIIGGLADKSLQSLNHLLNCWISENVYNVTYAINIPPAVTNSILSHEIYCKLHDKPYLFISMKKLSYRKSNLNLSIEKLILEMLAIRGIFIKQKKDNIYLYCLLGEEMTPMESEILSTIFCYSYSDRKEVYQKYKNEIKEIKSMLKIHAIL